MPFYTYVCLNCHKRFDILISYSEYGKKEVACKHCASSNVRRAINKVRVLRTDESRLEAMADPGALDSLENDPQSLGRMMRQMKDQVGEEMPPEFDEVVDRLEKGQSPDEIEQAIPNLGDGMDGGDAGMGGDDF